MGVLAATFTTVDGLVIAAIVVLLLLALALVAAEEALTRTNVVRVTSMEDADPARVDRLVRILEEREAFINPLRLVVLIVQLTETTLVALLAGRFLGWVATLAVMAANICVVFVVAEAVPRTLGILRSDRIALAFSGPVELLVRFAPIRLLANALISITNVVVPGRGLRQGPFALPEELIAMADAAVENAVLDEDERDLIESVIEFGDTIVREVMVPRTDMTTVGLEVSVAAALEVTSEAGFSRVPALGDNVDDVVGLVYVKDLIKAELDGRADQQVGTMLRPSRFVPETKKVAELLKEMQREQFHMAIAVDEYGGIAGLVTLEDLIEELVGEIVDEYDVEEPLVERERDGSLRVDARISIDELNDLAAMDLPEGDWDTVGGLVFDRFGRVPSVGETCDVNGYSLRVERLQGRRITRVQILRTAPRSLDPVTEPGRMSADPEAPAGSGDTAADADAPGDDGEPFRSGFVALAGRPNVGKSTLLNQILDTKVSIVSNTAQTTRHQVRGVLNRPGAQIVFVDTPGVSKPRTPLGTRLNESAEAARADVDRVCLVVDARSGIGRGDRFVADQLDPSITVGVINKIDGLEPAAVMRQLELAAELDLESYFAVSAFTGKGIGPLVDHLLAAMPEGPRWYPDDMVSDTPEPLWVAELVREQLLRVLREEVPHSVATRVVEWEWPRIKVEILVERNSQKGIVIGKGGSVLKSVGTRVRRQLPEGAFLELVVAVDENWQQDRAAIERLGY